MDAAGKQPDSELGLFCGSCMFVAGFFSSKVLQNLRPKQYQHSNTTTNGKGRKFVYVTYVTPFLEWGSGIDSDCFNR